MLHPPDPSRWLVAGQLTPQPCEARAACESQTRGMNMAQDGKRAPSRVWDLPLVHRQHEIMEVNTAFACNGHGIEQQVHHKRLAAPDRPMHVQPCQYTPISHANGHSQREGVRAHAGFDVKRLPRGGGGGCRSPNDASQSSGRLSCATSASCNLCNFSSAPNCLASSRSSPLSTIARYTCNGPALDVAPPPAPSSRASADSGGLARVLMARKSPID